MALLWVLIMTIPPFEHKESFLRVRLLLWCKYYLCKSSATLFQRAASACRVNLILLLWRYTINNYRFLCRSLDLLCYGFTSIKKIITDVGMWIWPASNSIIMLMPLVLHYLLTCVCERSEVYRTEIVVSISHTDTRFNMKHARTHYNNWNILQLRTCWLLHSTKRQLLFY